MKKVVTIVAIVLFGLLINFEVKAQKNEVRISYGVLTSSELIQFLGEDFLATALTGGLYSPSNYRSSGAIGVDYYYKLSKRWSIGANFTFEELKKDVSYDKNRTVAGNSKNNYFTFMPQTRFSYLNNNGIELYSGLSLGASLRAEKFTPSKNETTLEGEDSSQLFLAFQANLLGIRVGKKLGGFAELGFGNKGVINAGVSYKF